MLFAKKKTVLYNHNPILRTSIPCTIEGNMHIHLILHAFMNKTTNVQSRDELKRNENHFHMTTATNKKII